MQLWGFHGVDEGLPIFATQRGGHRQAVASVGKTAKLSGGPGQKVIPTGF